MTPKYLNESFAKAYRDISGDEDLLWEATCPLESMHSVLRFWRGRFQGDVVKAANSLPNDVRMLLVQVGRAKEKAEEEVLRRAWSRK